MRHLPAFIGAEGICVRRDFSSEDRGQVTPGVMNSAWTLMIENKDRMPIDIPEGIDQGCGVIAFGNESPPRIIAGMNR